MPGSLLANPTLLSLLGLLLEQPRHLYAISQELPHRLDANGLPSGRGSMRNLLTALEREHWIEIEEPTPDDPGPQHPARRSGSYRLTAAGVDELRRRVRTQLDDVRPDYDHFAQALAYVGLLDVDEAILLLRRRRDALSSAAAELESGLAAALATGTPELHVIEYAYTARQQRSAVIWLDELLARLGSTRK